MNEFLKASEPIVVEVKRRQNDNSSEALIVESPISTPSNEQQPLFLQHLHKSTDSKTTDNLAIEPTSKNSTSNQLRKHPPTMISVGIQTESPFFIEKDFTIASNESPIHMESGKNHNFRDNSIHNNNNLVHQCNMMNECVVSPEIDIEVI